MQTHPVHRASFESDVDNLMRVVGDSESRHHPERTDVTVDHNAERGHREEDRAGGEVPRNPGGSFAPGIEGPFRETTDDATNDAANSGDDATETSNQVCAQRAPVTAEVDADDLLAWQQRLACPTGNHPPVVQKRKTHGHAPREESPQSPCARGDCGHHPFVVISSHSAPHARRPGGRGVGSYAAFMIRVAVSRVRRVG
ncbi:hypothetical protein FRAHR75_1100005 [Frankia sp. Hr75.2]|nr:hypothetical protein FRAHR75_1100005 [Frankia sp. Hr75.2]